MTAYVVSYLLSRVLLGVRGGGSLSRVLLGVCGGGSLRRVLLGGVRSVLLGGVSALCRRNKECRVLKQ